MSALELRFLGDFSVLREGRVQPLPPSKKTRALLAYLSLRRRPFRREHLCELLWEVPDDPRGSLRWSLSKLRRLIDDEDGPRIIADRTNVAVDAEDVSIDVAELRALAGNGLADLSVEDLEAAASRYRGNFLEGLEFSNFHDFHSWCVAEREQSLRDRARLLTELVERLADAPERALPHARTLVGLSPYDETARATLIRLLNSARQPAEAEEQYQLGLRMLKEAGIVPSQTLHGARRGPPVEAAPARARAAVQAAARAEPMPAAPRAQALVARGEEVATLVRAFSDTVREGRAGMLLLTGAPGIGKSRLLETVFDLARQANALILGATAFESDAIRPFAAWIDALRALGADDHDEVFGGHDVANRDRLFANLSDLVARASPDRPVLLIFDDLHWCDDSSAAALHYVIRMNRDKPVFCVAAGRAGELRDNAAVQQSLRGMRRDGLLRELTLKPLPPAALSALIAAHSPGSDSERLSRECGGNPLLAIELARAETEGDVGDSLGELIRERLSRFGVVGAEVLRWAAVLRPRIDIQTLVRATGLDAAEVGEVLEVAERHAMLLPTERGLRFSHELIAEAVYTDISPLRRQVMHRSIAELLEKDAALDLARASDLAHHATQSGDAGLAARAMVSAGRLCLRFFANDDALSLARKGLQFAEALPDAERIRVEVELHDVLLSAGPLEDWEAAADMYAALAERALDHGALAHARLGYHMASYVRWEHGHWSEAREQSLQAERAIRGGSEEAHIIGMAETAKCLVMLERDLSQADALLMEAAALAKRRRLSHHAIATGLGMLRYFENRLDEAEELFQQARTLCKSAGDRLSEFLANEYLVMVDLQRGRTDAARARCEQLMTLSRKIRAGSEEPLARALLALCNYSDDDSPDALDAALVDLRIADAKHRLAYVLSRAAMIDCERGRSALALARSNEALAYAKILERATEMLMAHAVLAHCYGKVGEEARAAEHLHEVTRLRPVAAVWTGDIVARLAAEQ